MKIRPVLVAVLFCVAGVSLAGAAFVIGGCGGEQMACPMHAGGGGPSAMSCHKPAGSPAGAAAASPERVVNNRCPIMGGSIKSDSVPASLTREYKGQKVGFCCGGCPATWDKLSDADKDAKLAKADVSAR